MYTFAIVYILFSILTLFVSVLAIKASSNRFKIKKKITVGEFLVLTILSTIPVINIVVMFVSLLVVIGSFDIMNRELF